MNKIKKLDLLQVKRLNHNKKALNPKIESFNYLLFIILEAKIKH